MKIPRLPGALLFATAAMLGTVAAHSQTPAISYWSLSSQPGNQATTAGAGFENVSAADLQRGPGLTTAALAGSFNSTGWSTGADDYVSFGFNVPTGYEVDLQSLFIGTRSSADGPAQMAIYCSVDGFTDPVATFTSANAFLNSSFDLTALAALTGAVEFRVRTTSSTAVNGNPIAATGGFRITNFFDDGADTGSLRFTGTLRCVLPGAPSIGEVAPAFGVAGSTFTISGDDLATTTAVSINGVEADFLVVGPGQLSVTVPAGATTGLIKVTNPVGFNFSAAEFVVPALFLSLPATINEGVFASGSVTVPFLVDADLTVTLSSSSPSDLIVQAEVVIPQGFDSSDFDIEAPLDGVVDPNKPVTVTASAPGYLDGEAVVTVVNVDPPTVFAAWEVTGLSNYGPSPFAPTTLGPNITAVGLTRGAGVGTTGTAASNGWGGSTWLGQTDFDSAVAAGAVVTFSITPSNGFKASFFSMPSYNIRRSGTGPSRGQWQYRVGGGEFINLGPAITWGGTTSGAGNNQAAIDLSEIAALQDVPGGTTVEFRIVNYGASGTGTWYLNNRSTTGDDLVVNGVIEPENPEAPQIETSVTALPAFRTPEGVASEAASFELGGVNLAGDIEVVAPAGYAVSQSGPDAGFASSQTVDLGSLPATIYVRLLGTATGSAAGNVAVSSPGATTINVAVTGTVLSVLPITDGFFYEQSFSTYSSAFPTLPDGWSMLGSTTSFPGSAADAVWGAGTTAGLRGAANVFGYQHIAGTGTFRQVLTLRNDTGAELNELYIRYTGRVARVDQTRYPAYAVTVDGVVRESLAYSTESGEDGILSDEITGLAIPAGAAFDIVWSSDRGSNTGSSRQIGIGAVIVSTEPIASTPTVEVSGALAPFSTALDTPSASQSFSLAGTGLANGIAVTAPSGFQVSTDDVVFTSSLILYPSGTTLSPTAIHVRLASSSVSGNFAGIISCESTGAVTRDVVVSGTVSGGGQTFEGWAQGAPLDQANLLKYAIGGASSPTATDGVAPVTGITATDLTLTAIVRTNDPSLTTVGKALTDLVSGTWSSNGVTMAPDEDQDGVPEGCQRQTFSTPRGVDGKKFLRLESTLSGQ